MSSLLRSPKGFTLLEVLVALAITVAAAILLSNAWSGNILRVKRSTIYNNVATLLEQKMIEMEVKNQGKKVEEIKPEEGDFGKDFPQYRWTFEVQPMEMPDLTALIQAGSNEGVDQMVLTIVGKMQELVGKAVAEGKVTVYVNVGKQKENTFSATTYFVDFESEIPLSL